MVPGETYTLTPLFTTNTVFTYSTPATAFESYLGGLLSFDHNAGPFDGSSVSFNFTRSIDAGFETVYFSTVQGMSAFGSLNQNDYEPYFNASFTFNPGQLSATIFVNFIDDTLHEPTETFGLIVQPFPTAANVLFPQLPGTSMVPFTIIDDDPFLVANVPPVGGIPGNAITGDIGANFLVGTAGADEIRGFDGPDTIEGSAGPDLIYGNQGDDHIDVNFAAAVGPDTIYGGQGNDHIGTPTSTGPDLIYGNFHNDTIDGGTNNDAIYGGQGNDLLNGNGGFDTLFGNLGADTFVFGFNSGFDQINGFNFAEGDRLAFQGNTPILVDPSSDGEVRITLSDGSIIELNGIPFASFSPDFFMF